jgi:hypothetical protein
LLSPQRNRVLELLEGHGFDRAEFVLDRVISARRDATSSPPASRTDRRREFLDRNLGPQIMRRLIDGIADVQRLA